MWLTNLKKKTQRGFTLLEAMVALMVISIGFIGMAGVMIRTMQMQRLRDQIDESVKLARTKAGQLAQIGFSLLATGSTAAEQEIWGAPNEGVVAIGPLNDKGEKDTGSTVGPFPYITNLVVCMDDAEGGSDAATQNGDPCGDATSTRPDQLTCDTSLTEAGQARIRILTTFRDRTGKCHKVTFDQVVINFD